MTELLDKLNKQDNHEQLSVQDIKYATEHFSDAERKDVILALENDLWDNFQEHIEELYNELGFKLESHEQLSSSEIELLQLCGYMKQVHQWVKYGYPWEWPDSLISIDWIKGKQTKAIIAKICPTYLDYEAISCASDNEKWAIYDKIIATYTTDEIHKHFWDQASGIVEYSKQRNKESSEALTKHDATLDVLNQYFQNESFSIRSNVTWWEFSSTYPSQADTFMKNRTVAESTYVDLPWRKEYNTPSVPTDVVRISLTGWESFVVKIDEDLQEKIIKLKNKKTDVILASKTNNQSESMNSYFWFMNGYEITEDNFHTVTQKENGTLLIKNLSWKKIRTISAEESIKALEVENNLHNQINENADIKKMKQDMEQMQTSIQPLQDLWDEFQNWWLFSHMFADDGNENKDDLWIDQEELDRAREKAVRFQRKWLVYIESQLPKWKDQKQLLENLLDDIDEDSPLVWMQWQIKNMIDAYDNLIQQISPWENGEPSQMRQFTELFLNPAQFYENSWMTRASFKNWLKITWPVLFWAVAATILIFSWVGSGVGAIALATLAGMVAWKGLQSLSSKMSYFDETVVVDWKKIKLDFDNPHNVELYFRGKMSGKQLASSLFQEFAMQFVMQLVFMKGLSWANKVINTHLATYPTGTVSKMLKIIKPTILDDITKNVWYEWSFAWKAIVETWQEVFEELWEDFVKEWSEMAWAWSMAIFLLNLYMTMSPRSAKWANATFFKTNNITQIWEIIMDGNIALQNLEITSLSKSQEVIDFYTSQWFTLISNVDSGGLAFEKKSLLDGKEGVQRIEISEKVESPNDVDNRQETSSNNQYNFSETIQKDNSLNSDNLIDQDWNINQQAQEHIEDFMRKNGVLDRGKILTSEQVRKIYEVHNMPRKEWEIDDVLLNQRKWLALRKLFTSDQIRVLMEGKVCGLFNFFKKETQTLNSPEPIKQEINQKFKKKQETLKMWESITVWLSTHEIKIVRLTKDECISKWLNPNIEMFIFDESLYQKSWWKLGFKWLRDWEDITLWRNRGDRFDFNNQVSRNHLKISRNGDAIILEDLGSTNWSTLINRKIFVQELNEIVEKGKDRKNNVWTNIEYNTPLESLKVNNLQVWNILQVTTNSWSLYQFKVLENNNNTVIAKRSWGTETLKEVKWQIHWENIKIGEQLLIWRGRTSKISEIKVLKSKEIINGNKVWYKLGQEINIPRSNWWISKWKIWSYGNIRVSWQRSDWRKQVTYIRWDIWLDEIWNTINFTAIDGREISAKIEGVTTGKSYYSVIRQEWWNSFYKTGVQKEELDRINWANHVIYNWNWKDDGKLEWTNNKTNEIKNLWSNINVESLKTNEKVKMFMWSYGEPKHICQIWEHKLYVTDRFTTSWWRPFIVGYTMVNWNTEIRMFYRSSSEAERRATPWLRTDWWYSKAENIQNNSYETTTKVDPRLWDIFDSYPKNELGDIRDPLQFSEEYFGHMMLAWSMEKEISIDRMLPNQPQRAVNFYSEWSTQEVKNKYRNLHVTWLNMNSMQKKSSYNFQHDILTDGVQVDVITMIFNWRKVDVHFAHAIHNAPEKVRIANIVYSDAQLNSFGLYDNQINAWPLTAKPVDYRQQAPSDLHSNLYWSRSQYIDIRDLYQENPLIIRYKEKFG